MTRPAAISDPLSGELRAVRNISFRYRAMPADLSDCRVIRTKPWLIEIWEPLLTKTPSPPKARPYCCYIRSVIFYHYPYICSPWVKLYRSNGKISRNSSPGHFEEWDRVDARLSWDDVVEFKGEQFEVGGGTVFWRHRRWWMRHGARRIAS